MIVQTSYIVSGTTCKGEPFSERCDFRMEPQKDGPVYGTGYYMIVKTPFDQHLIDVRYEKTTDIGTLARRWIDSYYGKNAKDVKWVE